MTKVLMTKVFLPFDFSFFLCFLDRLEPPLHCPHANSEDSGDFLITFPFLFQRHHSPCPLGLEEFLLSPRLFLDAAGERTVEAGGE